MRARSIAIWAEKGGTCKSTTAVNLAAALGANGKRVLLVDLDPQATATDWIGWRPEEGSPLLGVLSELKSLAPLVQESRAPGVFLIPSDGRRLKNAEHALRAEVGGERRLGIALTSLMSKFDYVICDTPPAAGLLAASALEACGEALIPLDNSGMSGRALESVLDTLRRSVRGGCRIELLGILLSRYTMGTRISRDLVEYLEREHEESFLRTRIRESTKWRECFSHALPMQLYAPGSPATEDFLALAAEIEGRRPTAIVPQEVLES
jgi:chromosome partitioning protein